MSLTEKQWLWVLYWRSAQLSLLQNCCFPRLSFRNLGNLSTSTNFDRSRIAHHCYPKLNDLMRQYEAV